MWETLAPFRQRSWYIAVKSTLHNNHYNVQSRNRLRIQLVVLKTYLSPTSFLLPLSKSFVAILGETGSRV